MLVMDMVMEGVVDKEVAKLMEEVNKVMVMETEQKTKTPPKVHIFRLCLGRKYVCIISTASGALGVVPFSDIYTTI